MATYFTIFICVKQYKDKHILVRNKIVPPTPFCVTNKFNKLPTKTSTVNINIDLLIPFSLTYIIKNGIIKTKASTKYESDLKISPNEKSKRGKIGNISFKINFIILIQLSPNLILYQKHL